MSEWKPQISDIQNLTRAEKRRLKRQAEKKNKVYNMTAGQFQSFKEQTTKDVSYKTFVLLLGIAALVLRDKWGFGIIRLPRFIGQCIDLYDSFDKGYLTLDDMHKVLREDAGVDVIETARGFYFEDTSENSSETH